MNSEVILIGSIDNATLSEHFKYVNGTAHLEFRLAIHRPGRDRDGKPVIDYVNCLAWDRQAEILVQHGKQNALLRVEGVLRSKGPAEKPDVYLRLHLFEFLGKVA